MNEYFILILEFTAGDVLAPSCRSAVVRRDLRPGSRSCGKVLC